MTGRRGVWAAALVVGAVGCAGFYALWHRARSAFAALQHARAVESCTLAVYDACQDGQCGQRGYLMTGADRYLAPYLDQHARARANLVDLRAAAPDRGDEIERLSREVEELFDEMALTVALTRSGDKPRAYTIVDSDRGRRSMERIRQAVAELRSASDREIATRRAAVEAAVTQASQTGALSILLTVTLFGFASLPRAGVGDDDGRAARRDDPADRRGRLGRDWRA